jgi:hypothetical protein
MGSINAIAGASTFTRGLSSESSRLAQQSLSGKSGPDSSKGSGSGGILASGGNAGSSGLSGARSQLSPQEKREVEQLKQRDREVRQHEQAHKAAAGGYAQGGASYTYTTGPDGKRYATGGEVSIDVGAESSPKATIAKMETVKRAALAPAEPSSQDRSVYTQASQTEASAQQELIKENQQGASTSQTGSTAKTASPTSALQPQEAANQNKASDSNPVSSILQNDNSSTGSKFASLDSGDAFANNIATKGILSAYRSTNLEYRYASSLSNSVDYRA